MANPLDDLKQLIQRAELLCDRERESQEEEFVQFKQDCLQLLGAFGPGVGHLYRRLTELDFRTPLRAGRYLRETGRGILDPVHAYRSMDEIRGILHSALATISPRQRRRSATDRKPPRRKTGTDNASYSDRDDQVFRLIGEESFLKLGNDEIYKGNRRRLRELLGPETTADAIRAIFNRIRKQHSFPPSEQVKKSDQS